MSFGEEESEEVWEERARRNEKDRKEREKEKQEILKKINEKRKEELVKIAYETHLSRKPHNHIPIAIEDFEVFYSLEEECFYAKVTLKSGMDNIYLLECNKAFNLPIHW